MGVNASLSPPGSFAAATSALKTPGGKFSNASQFVSTSAPSRSGWSTATTWHRAPPVSLPTRTTSRRSSASRKPAMIAAIPRGVTSAPSRIASWWEPSGHVGISTRRPCAANRPPTSAHKSPAIR